MKMSFLPSETMADDSHPNRWVGFASFSGEEPLFRDHFPGRPLVPGVLLLEILRLNAEQALRGTGTAARLVEASRVRFIQPVEPPARLEARLEREEGNTLVFKAELLVEGLGRAATAVLRFEEEVL